MTVAPGRWLGETNRRESPEESENSMAIWNYRLDRTSDGKYLLRLRRTVMDMVKGQYALSITGPSEPEIPDRPMTRQEFYTLLADLAAKGYQDNLLQ
jgi:hypothetical protein